MNNSTVKFFSSKVFSETKIIHGFFTRNGGKSNKPFDSLNCSFSSGDDNLNVIENINVAKQKLKLKHTETKFLTQIHGIHVELIDNRNLNEETVADGSITQKKNISLAVLTADCAPIFLADLNNNIICAIHSGWRGCLNNIILEASIKIKDIIKSSKDIIAIIGPCINQENFEVDEIFKKKFIIKNSNYEIFFKKNIENNRIYFDMRGLIDKQLRESSINNIFHINKDTYTEESLFFSHRRTTKRSTQLTGRMINIIGFKQ
tara:strand:+ start:688 stop:1470 length:783 start_codon:yes stop_codon:yes gene_type:complete